MNLVINWFNGFIALVIVVVAWLIAFFSIYLFYRKNRSQQHINEMILAFAIGFGWTGITITFLSIVISGENVSGVREIVPYFSYSTVPVGGFAVMRLVWDMVGSPKSKNKVLIIYVSYSIFYYIILYLTMSDAVELYDVEGEVLDDWLTPASLMFYLVWIAVIIPAIPAAIGFNKIRGMTSGDLKKRSVSLLITVMCIGSGILLDTVILLGDHIQNIVSISRILIIIGAIAALFGLRPPK